MCNSRRDVFIYGATLVAAVLIGIAANQAIGAATTALDDYVYASDPAYGYTVYSSDIFPFHTRYCLDMVSGEWRDATEVGRTQWQHWLTIYVPHLVQHDTAMLFISGGDNGSPPDFAELDDQAAPLALLTGSVVAVLGQVPNQPLTFAGETQGRKEDALIAYSWKKFLENTSDEEWPAQLPMARAAVRAMDAVQSYIDVVQPGNPINSFVVAGGSKRGWTTWLAAAAENGPLGGQRVCAIFPLVIDVLNVHKSFDHHYKVYGFWAPAVTDYVDAGVMEYMGTPEMSALFDIVDPYTYRDRLTMPKFILNSAGDQFFVPDSWKFYYDDLPGPKRLRYYPNTDHSLSQLPDPFSELALLYSTFLSDGISGIPSYAWGIPGKGAIWLQTSEPGATVRLWRAVNNEARDFRYETLGAAYSDTVIVDAGGGIYTGNVAAPLDGWTAYMLEVVFPSGMAFSSGVVVESETAPVVLNIDSADSDVYLDFNSLRGTFFNIYSSEDLAAWTMRDSIVPVSDTTTWIDTATSLQRQFYRVEQVVP